MALRDRLRGFAGRAGAALQSFSRTPPAIPGVGQAGATASGYRINEDAKRIAASTDALFGRLTYGAGPILTRYSTYPGTGLTPLTLDAIFREADLGIMLRKADLDEQIYLRDAHLRCVDAAVRNAVVGKPFRVRPANESELALSLAKYIRAAVDGIDSFDRACYGLLSSHGFGYACQEIIYARSKIRIPGKGNASEMIAGVFPRQLDIVHNKHFRFNLVTDETLLDMGQGGMIPLTPNKFIFHLANDVWQTGKLGYMRAVAPVHMLKSHAIRDWAVFCAIYGIPNVLGILPRDLYEQSEGRSVYEAVLANFGQGKPALVPDDLKVDIQQAPMGGRATDPHAAMIGWCETQESKIIQGETLTTEIGGSGSYALGNVHADTKHDTAVMLARGLAGSLRSNLFAAIIELNMEDLQRRYGADADEIRACTPFAQWRIEREMSPVERMQIFAIAVNELAMEIGVDQVSDEMAFDPPKEGAKTLRGKPVVVSRDGGMATGSVEAAKGVSSEKDPEPAAAPTQ